MPKAVFNRVVIAEDDDIILLEGNHYFPPESVKMKHLRPSEKRDTSSWMGEALYFDVVVGKKSARDGAWTFPAPSRAARTIKDHIAFGGEVKIVP